MIFIFTAFIISGCGNQTYTDACHLKVQQDAKYTAEIVSTEVESKGFDYKRVYGTAKLQNGIGAWTNYSYNCAFTGKTITHFKLNKGW
jgi:hypothetical protein